jgi:hypothetical protein
MARKRSRKETHVETENQDTVQTETSPSDVAVETPPETNGQQNGRRPLVSWKLHSDRSTIIEVACWPNVYRNQAGEEYEQLSFTAQRSYRDQCDQWQTQTKASWRTHDLPILLFLLQKAHAFALERRMTEHVPF